MATQHLTRPTSATPAELVSRLGAVQAQDYAGAKWGIGQRIAGATDAVVERAMTDGSIIRTHVLRPTWHFVAPADLRWMLALTAPRVRALMAYHDRNLELDAAMFRRSNAALTKAMRGGLNLTREEAARVLTRAKIPTAGENRVGHLMMRAELDGVVCSGPRRGKQSTYALLEERVPPTKPLTRDESLAELARRYFTTRGPATAQDFAWWSGLTVADAKQGIRSLDATLEHETRDGRTYWWAPSVLPRRAASPAALLLPNYDEYFIGFKDRSAFAERVKRTTPAERSAALAVHIVVVDGQIVGGWKRLVTAKSVGVQLQLLTELKPAEHRAIAVAARKFAAFLELPLGEISATG